MNFPLKDRHKKKTVLCGEESLHGFVGSSMSSLLKGCNALAKAVVLAAGSAHMVVGQI